MEKEDSLYFREGQAAAQSVGAIVTLIVGVGVAVLILIFVGVLAGQTYELTETNIDSIGNNVVVNESFTAINGTAVSLNFGDVQAGTVTVWNSTNSVAAANYTLDVAADPATFTLLNNAYNNSAFTIDYIWGETAIRNSIKSSIVSGFSALETTGDYLPIIVLAVIIAIVLALVLGFATFGGGAARGQAL